MCKRGNPHEGSGVETGKARTRLGQKMKPMGQATEGTVGQEAMERPDSALRNGLHVVSGEGRAEQRRGGAVVGLEGQHQINVCFIKLFGKVLHCLWQRTPEASKEMPASRLVMECTLQMACLSVLGGLWLKCWEGSSGEQETVMEPDTFWPM